MKFLLLFFIGLWAVLPAPAKATVSEAVLIEIISVAPSFEEEPRHYRGTATGAGIGATVGAIAGRNASRGDQAAIATLGALVGGVVGNDRDVRRARVRGFDVVFRSVETGRFGSVFVEEPPPVHIGGRAFLVGSWSRSRLIPAPPAEPELEPAQHL